MEKLIDKRNKLIEKLNEIDKKIEILNRLNKEVCEDIIESYLTEHENWFSIGTRDIMRRIQRICGTGNVKLYELLDYLGYTYKYSRALGTTDIMITSKRK